MSKKIPLCAVGRPIPGESLMDSEFSFRELLQIDAASSFGVDLAGDRASGTEVEIEAEVGDVIELVLDENIELIVAAEHLVEQVLPTAEARDAAGRLEVPRVISFPDERTRGGVSTMVVKSIRKLGLKGEVVKKAAQAAGESAAEWLAGKIESQIVGEGGLFTLNAIRQRELQLARLAAHGLESVSEKLAEIPPVDPDHIDISKPILIFVHGTASSTVGSFAQLWLEGGDEWRELTDHFDDQIYGFEHRTLTQSPIKNALQLIQALPKGARVHFVSHSRGGLVAELACRGQLSNNRRPFIDDELDYFREKGKGGRVNTALRELFRSVPGTQEKYAQHLNDLTALSEALESREIVVERFVRVACPARGTTLASEKLDLYLSGLFNVLRLVPGLSGNILFEFLRAMMLVTAHERTDPRVLPGLEAQMPDSPLVRMLNTSGAESQAPLTLIEGDIEPSGFLKRLALLVADRFYEGKHDLVVNTQSMDGGTRRRFQIPVMSLDGSEVHHFSYFRRKESQEGIVQGLLSDEIVPPGFERRGARRAEIAGSRASLRDGAPAPVAFILPGITGSHLRIGTNRIWLDPRDLMWGGLEKLALEAPGPVATDGVMGMAYGDLCDYLAPTHDIVPFPYDWRLSILDASQRLAGAIDAKLAETDQPIRLVAHSMGGLVVRGMIARHPEVWKKFRNRAGSRVLMLGTPNTGSYAIPRVLVGQDKVIKGLALADLRNNRREISAILSRFPGILELLPSEATDPFFQTTIWRDMNATTKGNWKFPKSAELGRAEETWKVLKQAVLDPEVIFYIAGQARHTPCAIEVSDDRIRFYGTRAGDGRVPWDGGIPENLRTWFSPVAHGDLADHKPSFRAIHDILTTGHTTCLPMTRPIARGVEVPEVMEEDRVDTLPDRDDLLRITIGGGVPREARINKPLADPVQISVRHGDLYFAKNPIMVGHYRSDTIIHAESCIDERMDGRLSELYALGLYPGKIGTNEIVLQQESSGSLFPGAIIVGLGEVGELTPAALRDTLRQAFLRFALDQRNEVPFGSGLSLSTLLIGTNAGGLSIENSLNAMLEALVQANQLLARERGGRPGGTITELELIELYEGRALAALRALQNPAVDEEVTQAVIVDESLTPCTSGRRSLIAREGSAWWDRTRVRLREGNLEFLCLTRSAGAPLVSLPEQRISVEPFLDRVTKQTEMVPGTGEVLFNLLMPRELREASRENRDLILVLDEDTATYPWEILEFGGQGKERNLALRAGLIRQLTIDANRAEICLNREALVVGDPQSDFSELPGAQKEAVQVADRLGSFFNVGQPLLQPHGHELISHLFSGEGYQILHLAGHGVFQHWDRNGEGPHTGMVIGDGHFLTPEMIPQLPFVPEFVFLNCCHLGNTEDPEEDDFPQRPNEIAANLATQFIRQGVRAVIAAGWAVNDAAALTFADEFYRRMVDGRTFGKAVLKARSVTYEKHRTVNTWAAYQCYGDPAYTFGTGTRRRRSCIHWEAVSIKEMINEVFNAVAKLETADEERANTVASCLEHFAKVVRPGWNNDGELHFAFGTAWGALLDYEKAMTSYQRALNSPEGRIPIKAAENLADIESQYAIQKAIALADEAELTLQAKLKEEIKQLLDGANRRLEELNSAFGQTPERLRLQTMTAKSVAHCAFIGGTKTQVKTELARLRKTSEGTVQSCQEKGQPTIFPALQYLTAFFLEQQLSNKRSTKKARELLACLQTHTAPRDHHRESFWTRVDRTHSCLMLSLQNKTLTADLSSLTGDYQEVRRVASNPRQLVPVLAHLQFLHDGLKAAGDDQAAASLQELIHALMQVG